MNSEPVSDVFREPSRTRIHKSTTHSSILPLVVVVLTVLISPAAMLDHCLLGTLQVVLLSACLLAAGCGSPAEQHRVDAETARATLKNVLTSWQEGATTESWQSASPQVVVQDMEWQQGAALESFEILAGDEAVDANLRCPVRLVVRSPDGGTSERTVTYLVGTSPVLTVFRAMGP